MKEPLWEAVYPERKHPANKQ